MWTGEYISSHICDLGKCRYLVNGQCGKFLGFFFNIFFLYCQIRNAGPQGEKKAKTNKQKTMKSATGTTCICTL